jgi:hypothetical protein
VWQPRVNPGAPRFIHADLAKTNDCVGLACSHLYGFRRVDHVDNQGKAQQIQMPVVYFDFLLQIKPPKGSEIDFTKIISFIFFLRHIGVPVVEVTFDRFQSTHSQQILKKAGFESREISMDRSPAAYMGFKEAVMSSCCFFYDYEPLLDELAQLQVLRKVPRGEQTVSKVKIDHPPGGSKDVADAVAGSYFACISSKYTELQMAEGPMIDLKKPIETPGRPPANIETGLGSSWIYGDLPEMGHITGIYER